MPLLFALAWRNLWRNRRRTLVILFAIILGAWAMIVMGAFMRGMVVQMFEDTIDNLTGHGQIHHVLYLDDPVIDNSFLPDKNLLDKMYSDKRIEAWSGRIRVPGVVASERDATGVSLVGIDPNSEARMSFIAESVVEGRYLEGTRDKGVLIGRQLAEDLGTGLGKRIVLMSQDINNEIADGGFRIVGIFDAPLAATEKGFIFIGRDTLDSMLGMDGKWSEIAFRVNETKTLPDMVKALQGELPSLQVYAWDQVEPVLKVMVEVYDSSAIVWHLIVFLAMAFGIINTLLMAVFERTREFGLFLALGLKPRFILTQVWLEGILLIVVGLFFGNIISWLTVLATGDGFDVSGFAQGMEMVNMSNVIPFIIVTKDLVIANLVVLILGILTGLYPAWRASKLVPADALTRI